jgi:hypothetical protein
MHDRTSAAPSFPDAEYVGPHLIIDKTEWVPGENPEPHLREDGQTTYAERYLRCLRCGAERLHRDEFPEECDAAVPLEARRDADARAEADATGVSDG